MSIIVPFETDISGEKLLLRSAEISDAKPLLQMLEEVVQEQEYTIATVAEFNSANRDEAQWIYHRRMRTDQIAIVAVARPDSSEQALVGLVFAEGGDKQRTSHTAEAHLVVAKEYRKRGIGRALMDAQIDWVKRHPVISQLHLNVFATNAAALNLYNSLGFREDGRRPNAIRVEDTGQPPREIDDVLMSLRVK